MTDQATDKPRSELDRIAPIDIRGFVGVTHMHKVVSVVPTTQEIGDWLAVFGHMHAIDEGDSTLTLYGGKRDLYELGTWRKLKVSFAHGQRLNAKRQSVDLSSENWAMLHSLAQVTNSTAISGPRTGKPTWRALVRRIAAEADITIERDEVVIRLHRPR